MHFKLQYLDIFHHFQFNSKFNCLWKIVNFNQCRMKNKTKNSRKKQRKKSMKRKFFILIFTRRVFGNILSKNSYCLEIELLIISRKYFFIQYLIQFTILWYNILQHHRCYIVYSTAYSSNIQTHKWKIAPDTFTLVNKIK